MTSRKLFTESHAAMLVKRAGSLYRPSNGQEGDLFEELWCHDCTRRGDDANPCPILVASLFYDVDEPRYPREWQYGMDGQPVCLGHCKS